MIDAHPEKLQVSHQELEHKMIPHIFSRKMRILCREIITERKRTHHAHMHGKITEDRQTDAQLPVFDPEGRVHQFGKEIRNGRNDEELRNVMEPGADVRPLQCFLLQYPGTHFHDKAG